MSEPEDKPADVPREPEHPVELPETRPPTQSQEATKADKPEGRKERTE